MIIFLVTRCGGRALRRRVAWVKSTRSTGFCFERIVTRCKFARFEMCLSRVGLACAAAQRVHTRCVAAENAVDDLLGASGM